MRTRVLAGVVAGVAGLGALAATAVRLADARRAEAAWVRLAGRGAARAAERFDPAMVAGLPAPARRWFLRAIAPGTLLRAVAEIDMEGEVGLGDQDTPRYLPMYARQILAPPHGFVWVAGMGGWPVRVSGSDGYAAGEATAGSAWTRFWLLGVVPVARAADTPDLARSAVARGIAEAALWVPAALLPGEGVAWEPVDERHARAVVRHGGERFPVELEVAEDGRLLSLAMRRWSDANPERAFRWQPFGGTVAEERRFGGYTVAGRVEAGNHFGTEAYFPFFRARVLDLRFR
ncbi:MAG: hypothetical protein ICV73_25450 [Acetobacteraceae bacterium]|nr:hypothetical protein [Acetobacteraceae bacterium]